MIDLVSKIRELLFSPIQMGKHIWRYEYEDFRLIFEQSDELHYFYIKSRTQQIVARGLIVLFVTLFTMIMLLVLNSGVSVWRYNKLEASKIEAEQKKQEAIEALASLSEVDVDNTKYLSQDHLLRMASLWSIHHSSLIRPIGL